MSPSRNRFAIGVTWSWPITVLLLLLILMPIYAPLMPTIEGNFSPVTGKVEFVDITPVPGGFVARMQYIKLRNCEYLGASLDKAGTPIEFSPYNGPPPTGTFPTGPQLSRPWFIGAANLDGLRLRWVHRCNPLWLTVTVAYP